MGQSNVEVVRRWIGMLNSGRLDFDLIDEGLRIDNVDGTLGGPYFGHEGARQWWEDVWSAFGDLRLELEEVVEVDDERVVCVHRFVGRFRETGIPMDWRWASIQWVRGEKIVRAAGYASRRQALEAAGAGQERSGASG